MDLLQERADAGCVVKEDIKSAYLRGSVRLEDFIWPEDERPNVPYDSFDEEDFPVLDLSVLASSDSREVQDLAKAMAAAAADWGFFKIVNHNVPLQLVANVERVAHQFFQMPTAQKLLIARTSDLPLGYSGCEVAARTKNWTETLQIPWGGERIAMVAEKAWTSGVEAQIFIDVVDEYSETLGKLSQVILELLLQGCGVDPHCLSEQFGQKSFSTLRLNYYPPCPQPQLTFGTQPHNDYGVLTILHQDSVGGLQVLRNGRWFPVKPEVGSLIVNIGNCLQDQVY